MIFYANSLNQIKPDIIMSGLTLHSRHARISNGGGGEGVKRITSKISQKYSFFSNRSGPLKNHKATKPHFYVWPDRHSSETSFKWLFAGGPMMARL